MTVEELKAQSAKLPPGDRFALAKWIEQNEDIRDLRRAALVREIRIDILASRGLLSLLRRSQGYVTITNIPFGHNNLIWLIGNKPAGDKNVLLAERTNINMLHGFVWLNWNHV